MASHKLKVLLLYDVPFAPNNAVSARALMTGPEWIDERDVLTSLERSGHHVTAFGVFDDIQPLGNEASRGWLRCGVQPMRELWR